MTTIALKKGYYIEIDPLNYTLRQKYTGETKSGEKKEAFRTLGHFGNMERAIRKVIKELKSWEKASHDAGIQSTLDNKASGYYQESRAYHRAIEIVEKGGIE